MNGFSDAGLKSLSEALKGYVDRCEIAGLVALVARDDHIHVDAFGVVVTDQLTPEQKAASTALDLFLDGHGWGFGMTVLTSGDGAGLSAGSYGWDGGFGPSYRADPAFGLTTVLLTQQLMRGPNDVAINGEFRARARQAFQD